MTTQDSPDSLFILRGWFSVRQFFPSGNSDADTVKVKIATAAMRTEAGEKNIYGELDDAYAVQLENGKTYHDKVLSSGAVTVRLQHIDAPELHYVLGKTKFRQPRGVSSARRVMEGLTWHASDWIPCEVVTQVNHPSEAFDCYGRLVGDILYGDERRNLNLQILESGLALPSLYDSASLDERAAARAAARRGRKAFDTIWNDYTAALSFDPALVLDPHDCGHDDDHGPVVLPKLFRRLAQCYTETGATDMPGFLAWLRVSSERVMIERPGEPAHSLPLADILALGADGSLRLTVEPEALVCLERASTMVLKRDDKYIPWTDARPQA